MIAFAFQEDFEQLANLGIVLDRQNHAGVVNPGVCSSVEVLPIGYGL